MKNNYYLIVLLILFLFRLFYGLTGEFWFDDELQIYLIGLKYYTTGLWPYYGPDLVYTNTQIPGALQGLLVGLPITLLNIPESPTIFLNILSFFALLYFSKFIKYNFSNLPIWLIYGFIFLTPWAMVYSTKVVNPSYVLPFALFFFVSFIDVSDFFEIKFQNKKLSFFLIGISTTAIMQLHLSWVLLIPFLIYSIYRNLNIKSNILVYLGLLLFGLLIPFLLIIPTYMEFGLFNTGGTEKNILLNFSNLKDGIILYTRLLSFGAFEIPYILGGNNKTRLEIILDQPYMILPAFILLLIGWLQVILFTYFLFIKRSNKEWTHYRYMLVITYFILYVSFTFSIKNPSSHTFYLLFPIISFFSFYCYSQFYNWHLQTKYIFMAILVCAFIFYTGLGIYSYYNRSMYINREKVEKAIKEKDYTILAKRRADNWGYGY